MTTFRNSSFLTVSLLSMSVFLQAAPAAPAEVINLEVLNPIAFMEVERVVPVPRPKNLNGRRILLYWNRKLHADVAADQVKKQLAKRFTNLELKIIKGSPWQPEKGFYEEIVAWKPDAVIATTGD
jgi:CRISPR/Cas system endoribonuclease Cas6 (RAMP superfamily)